MPDKWAIAAASKDLDTIKGAICQGHYPANLHVLIPIRQWTGQFRNYSLISILLLNNNYEKDFGYYLIADALSLRGAPLPKAHKTETDFKSKHEYLCHLITDNHDLYLALKAKPILMVEQDEFGNTLLHYAASMGLSLDHQKASIVLRLLYKSEVLDFTILNKNGEMPLHIAAERCRNRVTCQYVFPKLLKKAHELGVDLTLQNGLGQSVIHIAARIYHQDPMRRERKIYPIRYLLDYVTAIELNNLTRAGASALYYCISWYQINEANLLLNAGAAPDCYEGEAFNPLTVIADNIVTIQQFQSQETVGSEAHGNFVRIQDALEALKGRILESLPPPPPPLPKGERWAQSPNRKRIGL